MFAIPSLPGTGGGLPISFVIQSTNSRRPRLRTGRGDQEEGDGLGQVHRRPGFAGLRQAAGPGPHRPPARRGARRVGVRHRQHAHPAGRREQVSQFSRDERAYDIIPQVPQRYRYNPEDLTKFFVRNQAGAMVPLSSVVTIKERRLGAGHRAVQPAQLGDALGPAAAGRDQRRRPEDLPGHRCPAAAGGLFRPVCRPVAHRDRGRQHAAHRLRPGGHRHLSGAGGDLRELPRPAHHHDGGAAVAVRRDAVPQPRPGHHQHLHRGRPDHPGRPDHQARHPDGAVRQPAARAARPRAAARRSSKRPASGCARS